MFFDYLLDPGNWDPGSGGTIPVLIYQHFWYSLVTVVIATAIALPIGLYCGHTGRFAFLAINLGNAGRALPTLGLMTLLVTLMGMGMLPVYIALVTLAVPAVLTQTYAGVRGVDPNVTDAARGMGMRPVQVLLRVEVPVALPLIFSGIRNAFLQVIATATVAAYVGVGGLGRLLVDGLALNQYERVVAGAVLVAGVAVVVDVLTDVLRRYAVSPGLRTPLGR